MLRRSEPRSSTRTAGRSPGCARHRAGGHPDDRRLPGAAHGARQRTALGGRCRLADHAEAVVREAISNAVRHAGARTVSVSVTVDDDLTIGVTDDGVGIGGGRHPQWAGQPGRRAEECAGQFSIAPGPGRRHTPGVGRRRCPGGQGGDHHGGMPLKWARHCRSTSIGTNSRIRAESKPRWASATASLISSSSGTSGKRLARGGRPPGRCGAVLRHGARRSSSNVDGQLRKGLRFGSGPIRQRADAGPTGLNRPRTPSRTGPATP